MSNAAKDFQMATAERILHIFKNLGHHRVLLADEVGLGKTFVARQVISLVKEWHREKKDDFFKVVYICSNANIADQNIKKLEVENQMSMSESRLSMQHLYITKANNRIANDDTSGMPESIIPLTPATSFHLKNSQGIANERALMFCLLSRITEFQNVSDKLSQFLSCDVKDWQWYISKYENEIRICGEAYVEKMLNHLQQQVPVKLISQLLDIISRRYEWSEKSKIINAYRRIFAEISIEMLDPDLVIMDEFQRFSDLLQTSDSEQSMLARKFFDPTRTNTKVLLLSATPYKPYSTLEEINAEGKDEHFNDFMKVMDFLFVTKDKEQIFRLTWQHYSAALKATEVSDITPLTQAKQEAEEKLYEVMCRTERFNDGIIDDSGVKEIPMLMEDVLSYAQGQNLLDRIKEAKPHAHVYNLPIEYVKSSPYLLSFMDKYLLKKNIVEAIRNTDFMVDIQKDTLLLPRKKINTYQPIPAANGKLKYLHDLVFGEGHKKKTHLLLWVPASLPYYQAGGLFEGKDAKSFSKYLIFSSWEMVPRMVSAMMSYYAELYTIGALRKPGDDIRYTKYIEEASDEEVKSKKYGRKHIDSKGILSYPCQALSQLYQPKVYFGMKLADLRKDIGEHIEVMLATNPHLKDLPRKQRRHSGHILSIMHLLDKDDNFTLDENLYIPTNAVRILTDIAIASPAVCAYRLSHDVADAQKAAKAIISMFNKSESAAVIDLIYNKKNDDDYYESVLDYCVKGNLQAVLDEYAHMCQTECLAQELDAAILPTTNLQIDTDESLGTSEKKLAMRNHFAVPFVDKAVTDKSVIRTANIRKAFNSPFRPFILSTTSIGQEGLDFHLYARKIVHWNLPSNPVDLEQREGRINRFKCLSIRRNVAKLFADTDHFTWDEIFQAAKDALKGTHSDMIPYWCLPVDKLTQEQKAQLEYIERIVPLYPLSRDGYRYERLIKVLALYRMTLGQPRQEELLKLLERMELDDEQLKQLTIDLCPYNKEVKRLEM